MDKRLEEKLLKQYGGKEQSSLPQTLMFDHVSAATKLLEKRRHMFEVQEALNAQKEEFARREDAFRRREDGLRRKDLELQESLIKFNKFLQENESKRNRALKRAAEEKKQREAKESEIRKLEAQLKQRLKEEAQLKQEVEKNIKYQDYLDSVVQSMSKFFPEIADILNRYSTLRNANTHLLEKQQTDETLNENTLREYLSYRKDKENQILNYNNEIAEMQLRMEREQSKTMGLQGQIEGAIKGASDRARELGQILSSVTNVLDRCEENFRRRHNKPQFDRSSDKMDGLALDDQVRRTILKLDEIAMFMTDFREIKEAYLHDFGLQNRGQQQRGFGGDNLTLDNSLFTGSTAADPVGFPTTNGAATTAGGGPGSKGFRGEN